MDMILIVSFQVYFIEQILQLATGMLYSELGRLLDKGHIRPDKPRFAPTSM